MENNNNLVRIPFKTVESDLYGSICKIFNIGYISAKTWATSLYDSKKSLINDEIIEKLNDILFYTKEKVCIPYLVKKLNYLITLCAMHQYHPFILKGYLKGEVSFDEMEDALPFHISSNVIDIENYEFVADFDSIYCDLDESDESFEEDEYDDTWETALALGIDYIRDIYNPDKNKHDNEDDTLFALDHFNDIFNTVVDFGHITVNWVEDTTYQYLLYHDTENIHIMFEVNYSTKDVTILNPITGDPMIIDIHKNWWEVNLPDDDNDSLEIIKAQRESDTNPDKDSFESIAQSQIELYKKKNSDYGSATDKLFQKHGFEYYQIMLEQKMERIDSLTKKDNQHNFEPLEDTLLDLSNYAILAVESLRKQKKEN